jgi:DNA-binding CsgD family transcriptional regulator
MVAYSGGTEGIIAALRGRPSTTPVIDLTMSRPSAREALLTPRELEILRLIAAGKLTREIAVALGVTIKTVENHKQRLFRKLDVQNQAHAVSIAIRRGLLTPATPVAHRA